MTFTGDDLARELRHGLRSLRRSPGFTAVVVLSLALGFALTAPTVAVLNAYLIQSLPYPAADRLYRVRYAPPGPWEPRGMSSLDWTSVADVVEFPITAQNETFYLSDGEYAQSVRGLRVGRGFLEALGARAVFGRSLNEDDFSGPGAALIGHALWRDRYAADPAVIGRLVRADSERGGGTTESFRIVGVLPAAFYFGRDSTEGVDLLVPLTAAARTYMVRLHENVPPALAEERLTAAARAVTSDLPGDWTGVHLDAVRDLYVADLRPVLVGVTVAAGLVLAIACANVSVLTMLRAMRRQKEFAVRMALGSGRWQLARMLLIEALLLCGMAVAAGLALTYGLLGTLAPFIETQLGRAAPGGTAAISLDATALLIVGAAAVTVGLSLGCLPLLMAFSRRTGVAFRREAMTMTEGVRTARLRSSLVAFEVGGTLILLVACGLTAQSVTGMLSTDFGFDQTHLVRARVVLRGSDYADTQAFIKFYERFTERLSTATDAPVVFTSWPPFFDLPVQSVETEAGARSAPAGSIAVGPGYFSMFGIALRAGRDFTEADVSGHEPVAVISETLARRLWPDGQAVGRHLRAIEQTPGGARPGPLRLVVGVAADVRQTYGDTERGDMYVPLSSPGRFGSFYMRSQQPLPALLTSIRRAATELDPRAMVNPPQTVESLNRELAGVQFITGLLVTFAAIAVFVAVLGIYAVTAYAVRQREREIAIRVAVGAARRDVIQLFLRESGRVLCIGLALGLAGGVAAGRVLESQLYSVRAIDFPTLVVTSGLLSAVGILATWWPARNASRRNPVAALKEG